ncbi:MAG: hypothetical protein PHU85_08185, partial [Phycisphaerae bacterium]|nr:hypothetical protein [Phycisphaerae bacterium]
GEAWVTNHSTITDDNPLGMNILYMDGHAAWIAVNPPAYNADPATQLAARNRQYLWRRVWKGVRNGQPEYLRWLVNGDEVRLPDGKVARPG